MGEATGDAEDDYQDKCKEIMRVREYTKDELTKMGFEVLESKANFLFAKCDRIDGEKLYSELKKRHILVRHFTKERICQFNRITVGTKEQMDKLLEVTREILKGE